MDLVSMQAALHLFERLTNEVPKEEEEFPKIRDQHQTLGGYIDMPHPLRSTRLLAQFMHFYFV